MADPPDLEDIYAAAVREGHRRLAMPPLEQISTGFIAGVTIVFGVSALGVGQGLAEPELGVGPAKLVGALAFGLGFVFLVVGRAELFTENFFDPVAAAFEDRRARSLLGLIRLWAFILMLNLVGGAVLLAVLTVEGALPEGSSQALVTVAAEIGDKTAEATFARAILAGALLTLLSYMLHAIDSTGGRISLAFMVGFVVASGPFDHVVVSALHLLFGVWESDVVDYGDVGSNIGLSTAGNLIGGLLLVTLTHVAQVKGARSGPG